MINCLIIDDEPVARQGIANYISKVNFLKLVGSVPDPSAAQQILNSESVDLIFLDINMPEMSGIEFLCLHPIRPLTIIITAYSEYAIQSYDFEVVDYLLKPVSFERFSKAGEKARERLLQVQGEKENSIFLKVNSRWEKINFDDVLYIESMLNYVKVVTIKKSYIVYSSLKKMVELFPPEIFLKVHKSFIVSKSKVNTIQGNHLYVGLFKLPIGRSFKEQVSTQILGNKK